MFWDDCRLQPHGMEWVGGVSVTLIPKGATRKTTRMRREGIMGHFASITDVMTVVLES